MAFYVYIMANKAGTVLYTGVTADVLFRAHEHREKLSAGFTRKYNVNRLVYWETFDDVRDAILREKAIKGGSRRKKLELINVLNPTWRDLYVELTREGLEGPAVSRE